MRPSHFASAASLLIACIGLSARADEATDFFNGKTLAIVVTYPTGSSRDAAGRLLGRHIGKHLPASPTVIVRNLVGAGGLAGTNYIYNVAPKDGSEVGLTGGTVPFGPIWSREGVAFEANRFNWIGSIERWTGAVFVRSGSPVKSFQGLLTTPVKIGATGDGDVTAIFPRVLNGLAGTKFEIVQGYRGSADLNLAIERGEVDGRVGWCIECAKREKPSWISNGEVRILLQLSMERHPDFPDVPSLADLTKTNEEKAIFDLVYGGQRMNIPMMLPPDVPKARVEAWRSAFNRVMKDPEFRAEASRVGVDVTPLSHDEVEEMIRTAYNTPASTIERAALLVRGK